MHFVKLIPITAITAAMGLVACGDSSSNAGIESCKVISENPLTLETVQQGVSVKITIDLIKDKVNQTIIADQDISEQSCREYSKDSDYEDVYCMGNKLITISKKSYTQSDFSKIKQQYISECNNTN